MTDVFGYGQPGYGVPNYSGLQNASLLGGYSSRAALDTPHVAGPPWDVVLSNGQAESVPDLGGGLHFYGPVSHDGPIATSDPEVMAHKDRQFSTGMNQAAIKIAALIGGGALLSNALPALGSGGAAAGDGLAEVSTGASYLPGGTSGFLGAPASEGLSAFPSLGGGSSLLNGGFGLEAGADGLPASGSLSEGVMGGPEGLAGSPAQASGEYGSVAGTPTSIPAGATQASGEYGTGGWLDKLTQIAKQGGSGGGSGQAQPPISAPAMPQRAAGGFLQQVVNPRPNYLGRFGDQVMAAQNANNFLLTSKLFGRGRT